MFFLKLKTCFANIKARTLPIFSTDINSLEVASLVFFTFFLAKLINLLFFPKLSQINLVGCGLAIMALTKMQTPAQMFKGLIVYQAYLANRHTLSIYKKNTVKIKKQLFLLFILYKSRNNNFIK